MGYWPVALEGRKGNNNVRKCKVKKYLFGNKTKETTNDEFRYSRSTANSFLKE